MLKEEEIKKQLLRGRKALNNSIKARLEEQEDSSFFGIESYDRGHEDYWGGWTSAMAHVLETEAIEWED